MKFWISSVEQDMNIPGLKIGSDKDNGSKYGSEEWKEKK